MLRGTIVLMGMVALCAGCSAPRVVANRAPPAEVPQLNLPAELRQRNWTAGREGSCVHASTISHLRWLGQYELADWWRQSYGGGDTATSILSRYRSAGLPVAYTDSGDPEFLEWAAETRRGAIIWFFPAHCVTFAGFDQDHAYLLDNNRPEEFLRIPKSQFLTAWRGYGGFGLAARLTPPPPKPWPAFRRAG